MIKDPEKILYILKKLKLPTKEKSAMRFVLLSHVETQERIRNINKELHARRESPFPSFIFGKRMLAGMVVILLVASTGVTLAAEDTLPGDLLYGVKIHVTEEVRGALTVGSTAKVNWEKDRVIKRVVETEKLIKDKKLTPARKVEAQSAIKKQIQKFDAMATSEKENANSVIKATSELEPTLKAHQEILETLAVESPSTETDDIIKTVEEGIQVSGAQESAAIDSISTSTTPDEMGVTVDEKIIDAENAIETLSKTDIEISEKILETETDVAPIPEADMETSDASLGPTATEAVPQASITAPIMPIADPSVNQEAVTATTTETPEVSGVTEEIDVVSAPDESTVGWAKEEITTDSKSSADAKIKSEKRKEVLLKAREMIALAKEKRKSGEMEEALRLAQQAYKDVLELNVGTQLSKDAEKDEVSNKVSESVKQEGSEVEAKTDIETQVAAPIEADALEDSEVEKINPSKLKAQVIPPTQ